MRSDSFTAQVLGNIARTAPPFAARHPAPPTHTLPARRPRSFLSWLRHALANEPLHDDSPGRDEMRSTHGEGALSGGAVAGGQRSMASTHEDERDAPITQPGEGGGRDAPTAPDQRAEAAPAQQDPASQHRQDAERLLRLAEQQLMMLRETRLQPEAWAQIESAMKALREDSSLSTDVSEAQRAQYERTLRAFLGTIEALLPAHARPGARQPGEGPLLTVAEVAAVMRVSKMTVYRMVHDGHLPSIRVGRSFRVPENAVHEYLKEAHRAASEAPGA